MNETSTLRHFSTLLDTAELASLGPEPRNSREARAVLDEKLAAAFHAEGTSESTNRLVRSLVLLWHDYLDESHTISQDIHTSDGSFLHGIMHRREPDYWNSKYWFNRVGKHPTFPEIARRVQSLGKVPLKFIGSGQWDPSGFVDACEQALKASSSDIAILQKVQEIEFRVLLEHFCRVK